MSTLTHEQFRERLLDYLYDELTRDERTAFEASLAESEVYRRELEAMRETVQLARSGLAALEEAPPARASQAALEFAAQHRAAQVAEERAQAEPKPSFWSWLRSPTFAAVAGFATVAALAVVSQRNVFDPKPDVDLPAIELGEPRAAPPPPAADEAKRERLEEPEPAPRDSAPPSRPEPASSPSRPALESAPARKPASDSARPAQRSFAPPPPPRASGGAAPNAPQKRAAESGTRRRAADPVESEASESRFAPPPPAAATAAQDSEMLSDDGVQDTLEDAVRAARQHVAEGRLREAARAYRELLRLYPREPRAPEWRRQLEVTNETIRKGHNR